MTITWLDLQRPLDKRLDRLLRDLDDQLRSRNIPYLLTGGMAREILLHHGHGCPSGRTTTDVDFGVALPSWEAYQALRGALMESGLFRLDPKQAQRLIHRDPATGIETKVDLVPFGPIAAPEESLAWPPDGSHVMRVLGYEQALSSAIHLRLDETRWIPLASAPGITALKLVAWADQGEARLGRDAVDFLEILRHHAQVLTDQELYDGYPEAMERYAFQAETAAAWILGRQVNSMTDGPLHAVIREVLQPESRIRMLNHFLRERGFQGSDEREAEAVRLLEVFREGFEA